MLRNVEISYIGLKIDNYEFIFLVDLVGDSYFAGPYF